MLQPLQSQSQEELRVFFERALLPPTPQRTSGATAGAVKRLIKEEL